MLAMHKQGKPVKPDICQAIKASPKDIEARLKELQGGGGDKNDDSSSNENGKSFTKKQDKTILGMKKNGKTWAEIATAVNATKDEVRRRFKELDDAGKGNKGDTGRDSGILGGFGDFFSDDAQADLPGGGWDPSFGGGDSGGGKKKDKNGKKNKNGKQKVQINTPDSNCSDGCQDCLNCPDCLKEKEQAESNNNNQNQNQNSQFDWNGGGIGDGGYNWKSNNDNSQSNNWDANNTSWGNNGQDPLADPGYFSQNQNQNQDFSKGYQAQEPFSGGYQPQNQNQTSFQDQNPSWQQQPQSNSFEPPPPRFQNPFQDPSNNHHQQNNGQRHLRPNAVWTQDDCDVLEEIWGQYVNDKWHHIQERFCNMTGRMVEWYIIEGKFREDGLA